MLKDHSYKVSLYKTSIIQDKTKKRILYKLPYYPDRIIQWAIMNEIEPIFRKTFTDFTCASIPGRGIHKASKMLDKWLNVYPEETQYCLKIDIKKFYPSINREILRKLLRKKFKDKDLLIELDKIIESVDNSDIDKLNLSPEEKYWYTRPGKGLPVGSYLSQYLANYYLAFFDHWVKEDLGCKYVIRYMDDIIILSNSKEFLWNCFYKIKEYLETNLDLELKSNFQVFPVDLRGIDFVGYRHFRGYKLLRKSTLKTCKKNAITILNKGKTQQLPTEKEWCGWVSSLGWLKWCNSKKFFRKYYKDSIPIINTYYILFKRGKNKKVNYQFMIYTNNLKLNKTYYNNNSHILLHHKKEELNENY